LFNIIIYFLGIMGDDQRFQRIRYNILRINFLIQNFNRKKLNLRIEIQSSEGDSFFELFQEIAEIDQHIWNLNVEKQRLLNLIS
jgi:hypothetical protein